jgi:hypothetical protein
MRGYEGRFLVQLPGWIYQHQAKPFCFEFVYVVQLLREFVSPDKIIVPKMCESLTCFVNIQHLFNNVQFNKTVMTSFRILFSKCVSKNSVIVNCKQIVLPGFYPENLCVNDTHLELVEANFLKFLNLV